MVAGTFFARIAVKVRMKPNGVSASLLAVLMSLAACNHDDCGGLGGATYIDITSIAGSLVYFPDSEGYDADTLDTSLSIPYDQLGLRVSPQSTYFSARQATPKGSWFGTAYACSPALPQPSEEIAGITVFSDADYRQASSSKVIAAGDTLNPVFEIYDYYSGRIVGLPDFLVDDGLKASDQGFVLRPSVAVTTMQQHQFTVHYRLTNGEFYTYRFLAVTIIPGD